MEIRLETKQMKLTKQTLKQIIKEELAAMLSEEPAESTPYLTINSSNSGEQRFWLRIGDKFYQLNSDLYKEIQESGIVPGGVVPDREVTNARNIESLTKQEKHFKPAGRWSPGMEQ